MKKLFAKIENIILLIVIFLFTGVTIFSYTSIRQLQGTARVVNHVGIVRGATQRLVKKELQGQEDNALIESLGSIIDELLSGEGPNNLVVLQDQNYLDNMRQIQQSWELIKDEIYFVRISGDGDKLFELSEAYYVLVNDTVFAAENYSEQQVANSYTTLRLLNIIFVIILVIFIAYYIRTITLQRQTDALNKIAYTDPLAHIPNRASCDLAVSRLAHSPPEGNMGVIMFDMNNLKLINDHYGHQEGDRVIKAFAVILSHAMDGRGFVGRYGGDEFLAVFDNATESCILEYLDLVKNNAEEYNQAVSQPDKTLSYAAGYAVAKPGEMSITELINQADHNMYVQKRRMKESR